MNYIKRCVGIPGDVLQIRNKQVYYNDKELKNPELMRFSYKVIASDVLNDRVIEKLGLDGDDYRFEGMDNNNQAAYMMYLTKAGVDAVKELPYIKSVNVLPINYYGESPLYPRYSKLNWTGDEYGPITIPKEGMKITLNDSTIAFYGKMIEKYEHNDNVQIDSGRVTIDGKEIKEYTFKQDYYFMMGDNRHNSLDSRYWGFVPADHIVGKGFFIWLSIDKYGSWFNKIRWSRFFRPIS